MKIDGNSIYTPVTQKTQQSVTQGMMRKDDFLKLFLTSLQYQDPSNAMDMNQMMNQMSQLSLMEQVQNMTESIETFSNAVQSNAIEGGMKFLGKEVEAASESGEVIVGTVDQIRLSGGSIQLVIGDQIISMQQVISVKNKIEK
ncbi:flagellar hook assembly protein FlgD [Ectobacillus sp. JY-23]|uniref:flagellar hook capping FlgD N-terminal domain-containing protein n=1 Tax=Ectobacillus sp. JY-23 TaxID=2933872 RepID=UPI001FF253F4|nr:flagellar hook capping FlgD N-terminal domain-containing protein [Ectobacillus sp. JY-23]UOY93379.1 flagellar hook assembly protein FlgD [Ectobacillus sp. JY-23]